MPIVIIKYMLSCWSKSYLHIINTFYYSADEGFDYTTCLHIDYLQIQQWSSLSYNRETKLSGSFRLKEIATYLNESFFQSRKISSRHLMRIFPYHWDTFSSSSKLQRNLQHSKSFYLRLRNNRIKFGRGKTIA